MSEAVGKKKGKTQYLVILAQYTGCPTNDFFICIEF